jgi:hypothetical protein
MGGAPLFHLEFLNFLHLFTKCILFFEKNNGAGIHQRGITEVHVGICRNLKMTTKNFFFHFFSTDIERWTKNTSKSSSVMG